MWQCYQGCQLPLLVQAYPQYRDVLAEAYTLGDGILTAKEDKHFNTNHAVLGYYLARSWKMQLFICDVITEHHDLATTAHGECHSKRPMLNMLCILKLSEHLAGLHYRLGRHELDLEWQAIETPLLEYLGLTEDDIEDLQLICTDMGIGQQ